MKRNYTLSLEEENVSKFKNKRVILSNIVDKLLKEALEKEAPVVAAAPPKQYPIFFNEVSKRESNVILGKNGETRRLFYIKLLENQNGSFDVTQLEAYLKEKYEE